jgi:hypothetical protein
VNLLSKSVRRKGLLGLEVPDAGEIPFHPLFRTLVCANAVYSSDNGDNLSAYGRRIPEQIALLELLREKQTCTKQELLSIFSNEMGLFRYFHPLVKIGLVKRSGRGDELSFQLDKTVQLQLAEESRRVREWAERKENGGSGETATVETPLGFLKLQPTAQAKQLTEQATE